MDVLDNVKAFWWHVRALPAHVVSRHFDSYGGFRIGVIKMVVCTCCLMRLTKSAALASIASIIWAC